MKKLLTTMLVCFVFVAAHAQSMKMVVTKNGEVVGRYVRTNSTTYTIDIQDFSTVPKSGHKVVVFKASAGQGIVYRNQKRTGNINVRKAPKLGSKVVAKIPEFDGVPDTYPCLGKVDGWYKIKIDGKIGYVREDMACWDGMDTF
ncbi:MAG: SH3 domain-containing protein [Bacteroidales bacterium]|nr:SH3 domain-containing protein [Candidatus Sodaliphilus aphodohippi]